MKNLTRNPLFYLSLALAIILGVQIYGFAAAYTPPSSPPPQGQPAQPLDTSSVLQTKTGPLILGSTLTVGSDATPNIKFDPITKAINFIDSTTN